MNNERYNQIIDEVYKNYITQARIQFQKWCEENPFTLINFREDTKELFLKSIKEDVHWFTGEKNYSQKWGLKIEERNLSLEERYEIRCKKENIRNDWEQYYLTFGGYKNEMDSLKNSLNDNNIPTKLITITYKDETIEIYE